MNIFKTVLLKTIMVCGICAFAIVNGFSGVIIQEDVMRVASDQGEVIEEVIIIKDTGERYTFVNDNGLDRCKIDMSEFKDGYYNVIIKTTAGLEGDSVCKDSSNN